MRHSSLCPRRGLRLEVFRRLGTTRWWKRERNSTDFGFLSSNGGAICNTVFRISTVGAEVKPFSIGLFVFGKRTVGLGLRAFCRVGRKIWSGIRLGRIRRGAWFVLTV